MQLVEQHVIAKADPRYAIIDAPPSRQKTSTMLPTIWYVSRLLGSRATSIM